MIKEISIFTLIRNLLICRDIHKLMDRLEEIYHEVNFKVSTPFLKKKIYIFQDRETVSKALQKKAKLPFVNHNFNVSHGHFLSINAVNTTDQLWKDLHFDLLGIFNSTKITPIMEKYKELLVGSSEYSANEVLEEYFLKVWAEYCFGPICSKEYAITRAQLIENVTHTFHGNRINRLPGIGWITSKLNYWRYASSIKTVNDRIAEFLRTAIEHKQGAFYLLYEKLKAKYPNAFEITLDNAFLGVLVYDFIYIVLLDFIVKVAKDPKVERKVQLQKSIHDGFLYPFRFRTMDESFDGVNKNDYCILNLKRAGLYFSFGSRFCSGANLFKELSNKFIEIYSALDVRLVKPEESVEYSGNRDIPIMTSRHKIRTCPFAFLHK